MTSTPQQALIRAARRASQQPFFLASVLRAYQEANSLDDDGLAQLLSCAPAELPRLALCRRPAAEPAAFAADLDHLTQRFNLDGGQLAAVVRQVDALQAMRQHLAVGDQATGSLRAARDRDEEGASEGEGEGG